MTQFRELKNADHLALFLKMRRTSFGLEEIERFMDAFSASHHQQQEHLKQCIGELRSDDTCPDEVKDDYEMIFVPDNVYFLDEMKKLADQLAIVALYKKLEIETKGIIRCAYPDIQPKKLYKIKELKEELSGKGISIESLKNYKAMNEVRCINNDIKHNGHVGSELAALSGWTKDKPLEGLDKAFQRLSPLCVSYFCELVDEILIARQGLRQRQLPRKVV